MEIIDILIGFFLMIIISTSVTVRGQPSSRFHVEAWLPFRNCEIVYLSSTIQSFVVRVLISLCCTGETQTTKNFKVKFKL